MTRRVRIGSHSGQVQLSLRKSPFCLIGRRDLKFYVLDDLILKSPGRIHLRESRQKRGKKSKTEAKIAKDSDHTRHLTG